MSTSTLGLQRCLKHAPFAICSAHGFPGHPIYWGSLADSPAVPYSPEARLVLAAARRFVHPDHFPSLRSLFPVDEAALVELAKAHAVLPLLFRGIEADCPQQMPGILREMFHRTARFNMVLTSHLLQLLKQWEAEGVVAVPVKGPVLAVHAYGDVALRSFGDLDFLVRRMDMPRAVEVLLKAGFRMESTLPWPGQMRNKEGELSFLRKEAGLRIDLHWELVPSYYAVITDADRPWTEPGSFVLAGCSVTALRDEDLLLFLCAHGSKHLWEKLGLVCDVAVLIKTRGEMDWDRVLAQAARLRCGGMLRLGLLLASDLLGARLPAGVAGVVRSDTLAASQARWVRTRLFASGSGTESAGEFLRFNLPMMETTGRKLHCLWGILMAPSEAEYRFLQLPPWLHCLYYPVRAARLAFKYARRLVGAR